MAATVAVNYLAGLADALKRRGLSIEVLFQRAGGEPEWLADPEYRIDFDLYVRLWNLADQAVGDPLFALQAGLDFHPGHMGDLATLLVAAPNLVEAIEHLIRYEHILQDGIRTRLAQEGGQAYIDYSCADYSPQVLRCIVEKDIAESLGVAEFLVREARHNETLAPSEIWFRHAPVAEQAEYEALLPCPVRFSMPGNRLIFDANLLQLETYFDNPAVFAKLVTEMEQRADHSLVARLRRLLSERLNQGVPEVKEVAESFGMSHRTFQRRLAEEQASFKDVVNQVRQELAMGLLSRSEHSISEIAYLVGFTEASTFHQAFKRWTGISPGEYRKREQH